MKKIINLIKSGVTYQVGAITDAEVEQIQTDIEDLKTATGTNTSNITELQTNMGVLSGKVETLETHKLFVIVTELPTEDIDDNVVYLVPNSEGKETNIYIEYVHTTNGWEELGRQHIETDLSNYYTKSEVDEKVADADGSWFGTQEQYNAIAEKKPNINYYIYSEE